MFHEEENSAFGVSFPDLPGCVIAGGSLDDAAKSQGMNRSKFLIEAARRAMS
jgi:hypothetical protein